MENLLSKLYNKRSIKSSIKYRNKSPLEINISKKLSRISSMKSLKSKHNLFNKINNNDIKNNAINRYMELFNKNISRNDELNMIKKNKLISFEEYKLMLDKNLRDYKSIIIDKKKKKIKNNTKEEDENDKDKNREEDYINKENTENENLENNEIILKKPLLKRNKSEPYYKVTIKDINYYRNPFESLTAINNNNDIFNEISKDSLVRQRMLFDNQAKNFENYSMKFKVKMPKIKVQDMTSKIHGEIPVINLIKNEEYKRKSRIEEDSLPKIQNDLREIKLFCYFKYPPKTFPEGKEQFSICTKGKFLYLSGGLSTNMKQMAIWSLNMETIEWSKLHSINSTNCRYGHTSVIYQNKIYFYGGRIKVEKTSMLVGLEIYSLSDNIFISSNVKGGPNKRRNHIAEIIGNVMLIHGGISEDNEVLDDCYLLHLQQLAWMSPVINTYSPSPKVFGHTSCLVIPHNILTNSKFNIYRYPDSEYYNVKNTKKKKIERGLYIFGGKTKETNGFTNNLWILSLGKKPLQWIKVETKGTPPSPRYFHSMDYFEKSKFIIIHGGRNDNISSSSALNDTYILDLLEFNWIKVHLYSNINNFKVISRFGHNSSLFSNKLIIFGGMNNNNYIGSSIFIINLDFNYSTILKTAEQIMIENLQKADENESKKMIKKLKQELKKFEIGVVNPITLPPIK